MSDDLSCQGLRRPGEDIAPQRKRRRNNSPERSAPTLLCRAGGFRQRVLAASVNDAATRRPRSTRRKSSAHTPLPDLAAMIAPEPVRSRVNSPLHAGRARSSSPEPQTPQIPFRLCARSGEGMLPTSVDGGSLHSSRQSLSSVSSRTPSLANSQSTSMSCFSTSSTLSLKETMRRDPLVRPLLEEFDRIRVRDIENEEARAWQGIQAKHTTMHRELVRKEKKELRQQHQVKTVDKWRSSDREESRRSQFTAEVAVAAALSVLIQGNSEVAIMSNEDNFHQRLRLAHKSAIRSGSYDEFLRLSLLRRLHGGSNNDRASPQLRA